MGKEGDIGSKMGKINRQEKPTGEIPAALDLALRASPDAARHSRAFSLPASQRRDAGERVRSEIRKQLERDFSDLLLKILGLAKITPREVLSPNLLFQKIKPLIRGTAISDVSFHYPNQFFFLYESEHGIVNFSRSSHDIMYLLNEG